jgi:endoglycosylceramidase
VIDFRDWMRRGPRGAGRRTGSGVIARAALVLLPLLAAASGCSDAPTSASTPSAAAAGPVGVLGHDGRWLTDETGRVTVLHGVNFVQKFPPVAPSDVGFGEDDAVFLAEQGFNVVRLGAVYGAIMPSPGQIDDGYVASIAQTARQLAAHGIYVLIDFHQDGYGPLVHGNGFPEWATLTDGLPNPMVDFPVYYVSNPALQRAFDNFWDDVPGPDGVPLQDNYASAVRAVAAAVADEPRVLGYDLMNEPWPGMVYQSCLTGCPDIEQARLVPFGMRMSDAIRAVDPHHIVFSEPWVLFNFGQTNTSLAGIGAPQSGLSFHVYALSAALDAAVIDNAIASATGDALAVTEFGATDDTDTITRLTDDADTRLVPWMFWSFDEHVVLDKSKPPTPDNVATGVLHALARPYASATNGTPTGFAYDASGAVLDYSWSTTRPDGSPAPGNLATTIVLPPSAYGSGYTVGVTGGRVVSAPCAPVLAVVQATGAATVSVRVTPDASCASAG